jgi:hypothetical protein
MSAILDEIRAAYEPLGMTVEGVATYGTYYRLRCAQCGAALGCIGDRLLPGMASELADGEMDLCAAGLAGCACGHQGERAAAIDPARAAAAKTRFA